MLPNCYYHLSETACRKPHLTLSEKRVGRSKELFINEPPPGCCWHSSESRGSLFCCILPVCLLTMEDHAEVNCPSVKSPKGPGSVCRAWPRCCSPQSPWPGPFPDDFLPPICYTHQEAFWFYFGLPYLKNTIALG